MEMGNSTVRTILEYFKGQPFSNVISFLQLGLLAGAVYLGVFVLIPAERQAIIEGYDRQEQLQTKQIDRITEESTKQIERVANSFERALDRISGTSYKPRSPDVEDQ